ncbi:unnamed protein product [Lathyrus oleraceus]
MQVAASC